MASASSLHSEEQFLCSICLDVFTDPITTSCGHNYCKTCMTNYWDCTDVCQCPLCKEIFYKRPKLSVNKVFSEMADQFRKSEQLKKTSSTNQEPAQPDEVCCEEPSKAEEVFCDICTETNAIKTCLVCRISYCETHLEPHQRVTKLQQHKLINPVKNLEDIMCKKHDRPLELFCKTDHMCVCQFCTESDHKSHQTVSLEEECDGKKIELGKTEAEVQQMIQERQEKIKKVKHSVKLSKKDADREIEDSVQVFTALISCIKRSQAEVIDVIEEKQKTTEKQAEGFIQELEQEITELKKRSSELKQLSHTEDQLHLLQNFTFINTPPPTKDWTKVNVHLSSYVGTVRTAVAQLEKTLSQEMKKTLSREMKKTLSQEMKKTLNQGKEKLCDELGRIQQYAVDVTLDPDTANHYLILSEDRKQVSLGDENKHLPDNKDRFSTAHCVLGKPSFSSGRFYYEVQVKDKTNWELGVVRESIHRKENITLKTYNGFWTLYVWYGNAWYGKGDPRVSLRVRDNVQTVGVFVDYEEGLVSFYDVETRVHLYSFTGCTFTGKIYPYFNAGVNINKKNYAPMVISPISHTN